MVSVKVRRGWVWPCAGAATARVCVDGWVGEGGWVVCRPVPTWPSLPAPTAPWPASSPCRCPTPSLRGRPRRGWGTRKCGGLWRGWSAQVGGRAVPGRGGSCCGCCRQRFVNGEVAGRWRPGWGKGWPAAHPAGRVGRPIALSRLPLWPCAAVGEALEMEPTTFNTILAKAMQVGGQHQALRIGSPHVERMAAAWPRCMAPHLRGTASSRARSSASLPSPPRTHTYTQHRHRHHQPPPPPAPPP